MTLASTGCALLRYAMCDFHTTLEALAYSIVMLCLAGAILGAAVGVLLGEWDVYACRGVVIAVLFAVAVVVWHLRSLADFGQGLID